MRIRSLQIWKHGLAIFLPVAFIVGGLITAMPINLERPYELQLAERFITPFVLLGFLALPAQVYYDFIGLTITPSGMSYNTSRPDYIALLPETGFPWVAVALLIVSGVLSGVLLWKLQTGLLARKSIRYYCLSTGLYR